MVTVVHTATSQGCQHPHDVMSLQWPTHQGNSRPEIITSTDILLDSSVYMLLSEISIILIFEIFKAP